MPEHSATVDVAAPPGAVFAILDAVERTPEWLAPCTRLENLSGGPAAAGTRLRLHYALGGRTGTMDGAVAERVEDRALTDQFADGMMDVRVAFTLAAGVTDGTSRVTVAIRVDAKGLKGRLLLPLIGSQLPGQTGDAAASLKRLAEAGGGA